MQEPTEDDQASIPTDNVRDGPTMNLRVERQSKSEKRSLPFDLTAGELDLVTPPQDEEIPTMKKPRLEEPLPTTSDQGTRETDSPDVSVGLSPPTADNDDTNANADSVTDTQPNAGATWATGSWTYEEDAKLTRAVANTSKKKRGKKYKPDWAVISALVPGRTRNQCRHRWHDVLDPSIGRASGRKGKWTAVEDSKLKGAVQTHGDKDWGAVAALVPGRTKKQCSNRWHDAWDPSIALTGGSNGKWTEAEDSKLKDAVQTDGDNDWVAISALIPGRTKRQCNQRWYNTFNPSIALTAGRTGKWEEDEDKKLKDAIQMQGVDKDWAVISAMVPGRTKNQCNQRWHDALNPSIGRASRRKGKWSAADDSQLKHAVQTHGDNDWVAISTLVPGRTKKQCWDRWRYKKDIDPNRSTVQGK
jgi:hypothetical protein